jgi:hypothetical protein
MGVMGSSFPLENWGLEVGAQFSTIYTNPLGASTGARMVSSHRVLDRAREELLQFCVRSNAYGKCKGKGAFAQPLIQDVSFMLNRLEHFVTRYRKIIPR